MCGQVVGHDEDSVVVTGILPVFALAERFVMWTNMTECMNEGGQNDRLTKVNCQLHPWESNPS